MKNIRKIVEANLDDSHFSVKRLCREAGISHPQLHRQLKSKVGLSAGQLIRYIRLSRAMELLGDPAMQIADVAYETGFSDPNYFSKVFRKEIGCTPTEYRAVQFTCTPEAPLRKLPERTV